MWLFVQSTNNLVYIQSYTVEKHVVNAQMENFLPYASGLVKEFKGGKLNIAV